MDDFTWTKHEKKIAKKAFDKAYNREMESIKKELLARIHKMNSPEQIWELHDFLGEKRKEIDEKYEFRYSLLVFILGRLLYEGFLLEEDVQELGDDKKAYFQHLKILRERMKEPSG